MPLTDQISLLTVDELQKAQAIDTLCQQAQDEIDNVRPCQYVENLRGLIVRMAPVDGAVQIL